MRGGRPPAPAPRPALPSSTNKSAARVPALAGASTRPASPLLGGPRVLDHTGHPAPQLGSIPGRPTCPRPSGPRPPHLRTGVGGCSLGARDRTGPLPRPRRLRSPTAGRDDKAPCPRAEACPPPGPGAGLRLAADGAGSGRGRGEREVHSHSLRRPSISLCSSSFLR